MLLVGYQRGSFDLYKPIRRALIICAHTRRTRQELFASLDSGDRGKTRSSRITRSSEDLREKRTTGAEVLFMCGKDFSVSQPVNLWGEWGGLDGITSTPFWQPAFYFAVVFPEEINRLSNSFECSAEDVCSCLRGDAKNFVYLYSVRKRNIFFRNKISRSCFCKLETDIALKPALRFSLFLSGNINKFDKKFLYVCYVILNNLLNKHINKLI